MRSGYRAPSPALRETRSSGPREDGATVRAPPTAPDLRWAVVGIALFTGAAPISFAVAQAVQAEFHQQEYDNPQPTQPIFAQTWPGLIAANNAADAHGLLPLKLAPGVNAPLILNNAELAIPGGRIVASINSGMYSGCHTGSLSQDTESRAFSCPARVTIYANGQVHTIDAGYVCRVGGTTPDSAAHLDYDPKTKTLRFSATIEGKPVPVSNTGESCDRTLSLTN